MYDVAVIGAGVIGSMIARELSGYKLKVCLIEKENDVAMGASKANSGVIHGGYNPMPGTLKARLNASGAALLYRAAKELNVPCKNNGSLVVAFGTSDEEKLNMLLERGRKNKVPGLRILSGAEARKTEPALSEEISRALLVPSSGIICPYELTIAAAGNAIDNGVEFRRNFCVEAIHKGENFTIEACSGEFVETKYIVNCAGCFADRIARMAGDESFRIVPRAGEYMLLDKAEGKRVSRTIFQVPTKKSKGVLVTPTVDGNLLIGPTAHEAETPDEKSTTDEGLDYVCRQAKRSIPSIDFSQVITAFAGTRSSEACGDFIIEPSKQVAHLVHVAAIDSPGLTCCAAIAKFAVKQLKKAGLELEKKAKWDGTRESILKIRDLPDEEKDLYIRQHPDYGKIVCRCEAVSEGEIREALRRNPFACDLDGVKRRTRAGMGRCQGGFCSGAVMKLIAEERGIRLEDVTKRGKGSELLAGRL